MQITSLLSSLFFEELTEGFGIVVTEYSLSWIAYLAAAFTLNFSGSTLSLWMNGYHQNLQAHELIPFFFSGF